MENKIVMYRTKAEVIKRLALILKQRGIGVCLTEDEGELYGWLEQEEVGLVVMGLDGDAAEAERLMRLRNKSIVPVIVIAENCVDAAYHKRSEEACPDADYHEKSEKARPDTAYHERSEKAHLDAVYHERSEEAHLDAVYHERSEESSFNTVFREQPAGIRTSERLKLAAFQAGADDYITADCSLQELLARIEVQLRRYRQLSGISGKPDKTYRIGELVIDDRSKSVTVHGRSANLTPVEYKILKLLVQEQGKVISTPRIYETVWNMKAVGVDNTIAVHIRHIREKIETNPRKPQYVKVVWGTGYKVG